MARIVVVGGAGAMGRITVRDLVETAPPEIEVVVADHDVLAARRLARRFAGVRKVRAVEVDVTKVAEAARVFSGAFGVIAAVQHQFNLQVMAAALRAGCHYTDLGGLFHVTKKQLALHRRFADRGLTAVVGMGAAPGVVNVLCRSVADALDEVREIRILVGNIDRTRDRPVTPLGTSYSILTILDEATLPAALFTGGKLTFVEPMSGTLDVHFPPPVGLRRPSYTIHSEVATLPASYAKKGVREVSFRIAFDDVLEEKLRFLRALGLTATEPLKVGTRQVVPRELLLALLKRQPPVTFEGTPDEHEVLRVVVRGKAGGAPVEETVDCHCPGLPAWGVGVDADTGCPPSILMQMLARGEVTARGVLPPERAVPAVPFFAELERRGMRIERRRVTISPHADSQEDVREG